MRRGTMASLVVVLVIAAVLAGAVWLTRWRDQAAAPRPSTTSPSTTRPSTTRPSTTRPTGSSVPTPSATRSSSSPTTVPTAQPVPGVPKRPKDAQPMTVTYVYDGDTLQLQAAKPGAYVTTLNKVKVRLVGVNAPEMTPKKQCFAQQATDRLKRLAPVTARVWVKPDRDSWDDYKRRLFLVWTDGGVLIDHDLVAGGYGEALRIYPNITYWPVLEKAQAKARKAKAGLWGRC